MAIDGPALTIRKFKKDRPKLEQLLKFKSISREAKTLLEIIGRVRCNVLISGGTGSGKTTPRNCLTGSIDHDERSITCEDSAEPSYLQDRRLAFENLGERAGHPGIKAVAKALTQAERYGTPVGHALRVIARATCAWPKRRRRPRRCRRSSPCP